jgi:hypothetical protein
VQLDFGGAATGVDGGFGFADADALDAANGGSVLFAVDATGAVTDRGIGMLATADGSVVGAEALVTTGAVTGIADTEVIAAAGPDVALEASIER